MKGGIQGCLEEGPSGVRQSTLQLELGKKKKYKTALPEPRHTHWPVSDLLLSQGSHSPPPREVHTMCGQLRQLQSSSLFGHETRPSVASTYILVLIQTLGLPGSYALSAESSQGTGRPTAVGQLCRPETPGDSWVGSFGIL